MLEIREIIFMVATETDEVGPLTETLKWDEAAYLTEASKSGTTIRLGTTRSAPEECAVLFNCKTMLIETFRTYFADDFAFEDNRALIVPTSQPLPREPLILCLRAALTYHRWKGAGSWSQRNAGVRRSPRLLSRISR
ncbi:DUF1801 domain-containing protein [Devosia nitrariae]|uniref:DUF1801 domain-containing protein n=1 Tax=Devosia nitrariae TaxID=2071872 RepID=UPI0024E0FA52|nr:DUF1801 domain-containing protein [Devosia nitrariae]